MMNYEKMLFFPKTEMSTRSSSLPPPLQLQPQSNLTTATSTASSTPPAAFLTPSPEAYAAYAYADADTFDLSLLPNESDLPLGSDGSHEFLPRTTAATTTTPPLTAAAAAESTRTESTSPQIKIEQSWARDCVKSEFESLPAPANYDQLQQSQCHQQCQPQCQQGQCQQGQCQQHLLRPKSQSLLVPPPPAYPTALAAYPSPQSSPAQSGDYGFPTPFGSACSSLSSSRSSLYPPSPCPSLDTTNPTTTTTASPISSSSSPCNATAFPTSAAIPIASSPVQIKQEFHILPPSPPESSCEAPSPPSFADIKSEPLDADVENLIDINSLLESSLKDLRESTRPQARSRAQPPAAAQSRSQSLGSSGFLEIKQEGAATAATAPSTTMAATAPQSQAQSQCCSSNGNGQDHQLLREYLEDTSFQKKHNLKPLALESLIGGLGERGDIEPVISLALEYAKLEAEATCAKLQISPDPKTWTAGQTHAWLRSTIDQFQLPPLDDLELRFPEDGTTLALLTEEEFVRRAPEIGSTIHAQLEIWKLVYSNGFQEDFAPTQPALGGAEGPGVWTADCDQPMAMDIDVDMDVSDDEDDEDVLPPTSVLAAAAGVDLATAASSAASGAATKPVGATPARNGGSHIHLWQFLKELLAAPHLNGTAIRWIDRSKGVFKIEDSVRVAKLWGRRKNRPAMNYDKLSRSIRQYYKKGIMKKTERSQRLVYQFCHPYSL